MDLSRLGMMDQGAIVPTPRESIKMLDSASWPGVTIGRALSRSGRRSALGQDEVGAVYA